MTSALLAAVCLALAACGQALAGEGAALTVGEPAVLAESKDANQLGAEVCALKASEYLVVWQEGWAGAGGKCVIRGCLVKDGKPGAAFSISPAAGIFERPAVAFAPASGKVLVAWQEFVGEKQYDLKGQLLSADGQPAGAVFSIANGAHNEVSPGIGSDGKDFLVAWQAFSEERKGYSLFCSRVSSEGKLLDSPASKLSDSGSAPSIVFNGQDYVAVYDKGGGVHARRVARDGKIIDEGDKSTKLIGLMGGGSAAATDGREVMVAAAGTPAPDPWGWGGPGCICAARVTRDGECPERKIKFPEGRDPVADKAIPILLDATAWKGRKGWPQGAPGGFRGTENGTWPVPPVAIAWTGKNYLVVWPRVHLAGGHVMTSNYDLYAGFVSPDPVKSLCDPIVVAAGKERESRPSLATAAAGDFLLVYEASQADGRVVIMARKLTAAQP